MAHGDWPRVLRCFFGRALLGLGAVIGGCTPALEPSGSQGQIFFEGRPVSDGSIRFFPLSGTPGQGAAVRIDRGRYVIPAGAGLTPGTYAVAITATRPTGRKLSQEPGYESIAPLAEEEQYIPERFNASSELRVTLVPGENQHDFRLSAKN